jgi:hypothetical protein
MIGEGPVRINPAAIGGGSIPMASTAAADRARVSSSM